MTNMSHLAIPFDQRTMTTAGVAWGELPIQYHAMPNSFYPVSVGEDEHGNLAWPVFPTWTFVELAWSDAAQLAHLVARAADLPGDKASLQQRLLDAALPPGFGNDATNTWQSRAQIRLDILEQGAHALTSTVVLERSEAADLFLLLINAVDPKDKATARIDDGLLGTMLHAALPLLLFKDSEHLFLQAMKARNDLLAQGRAALPAFLVAPASTTARTTT